MSLSYDSDADLAIESPVEESDFIDDYDEMFDDEDFRALGLDPLQPTAAKPGSEEKVMMLAARYASGLPLWHNRDCYDHGPARFADVENEFDDDED